MIFVDVVGLFLGYDMFFFSLEILS